MHRVNSRKLKELMREAGEGGLAKTSLGAMVSVSTLEKMLAGTYDSAPRRALRIRLAEYFKVAEDDLFPLTRKKTA